MPTTIFTRQPDRENYLIESGNSLYKEQNAQLAKVFEDYHEQLVRAGDLERENHILKAERDALSSFLDMLYAERCRRAKKKPEPHPDVPILLSAARMKAAEDTKQ